MGKRIAFDKGDFIGRDALLKIKNDGPTRQIRGAFVDGPAFTKNNEHRWAVRAGDKKVGEMSSAVHSPRLDRNIGFVLLDADVPETAENLTVETAEGVRKLTLTTMPFIDPDKKIPRADLTS